MGEYEKMALDFCKKYDVEITFNYLGKRKREDFGDDVARDTYSVEINRNGKAFSVIFSDSLFNTEKNESRKNRRRKMEVPSEYDLLACLTKYDPGSFDDFILNYGYEIKSHREYIKLNTLYYAVKDEYENVYRMFSDCLDELQEIS